MSAIAALMRAVWCTQHPILRGAVAGLGFFIVMGLLMPPLFWVLGLWWGYWR